MSSSSNHVEDMARQLFFGDEMADPIDSMKLAALKIYKKAFVDGYNYRKRCEFQQIYEGQRYQ